MLSLVVVAIMLGFPTAFTRWAWACSSPFFAYQLEKQSAAGRSRRRSNLMVQRAYSVMATTS